MQRPICHQPEHRDDMRRQRNLHHSSRLRLERNETILLYDAVCSAASLQRYWSP